MREAITRHSETAADRDATVHTNGSGDSTGRIQAAIDRVSRDGGVVRIGPGVHKIGTLILRSRVELQLESGSILLGTDELSLYPPDLEGNSEDPTFTRALIYAADATDVAITGTGTICGQGPRFLRGLPPDPVDPRVRRLERPMLVRLVRCTRVRVSDVRMTRSASWTLHLAECSEVRVTGIQIAENSNPNNDGIDIDGCRNVFISDCTIDTADDAVCLKMARSAVENVFVSRCVITSGTAGFKVGTASRFDCRNVHVADCTFVRCRRGVVKLLSVDGGVIERLFFTRLVAEDSGGPIFIRLGRRHATFDRPALMDYNSRSSREMPRVAAPEDGAIRDVHFAQLLFVGGDVPAEDWNMLVTGVHGAPVERVTISDSSFEFPGGVAASSAVRHVAEDAECYPEQSFFGVLPSAGFFVRHARGLQVNNCIVRHRQPDERGAVVLNDVSVSTFGITWADSGAPVEGVSATDHVY